MHDQKRANDNYIFWKRLGFICAFILIPLLFLGFFNYPSADDYAYAVPVLKSGFWAAQKEWYQIWSGRFIATALLCIGPVVFKSFFAYKFVGIFTFLAFLLALNFFLKTLLAKAWNKNEFKIFFVLFTAVLLSEIPSITEAFHWYSGVVTYTWAFILFLFGLSYYLRTREIMLEGLGLYMEKPPYILDTIILSVFSFALAGFNETLILLWMYLAVIGGLVFWVKRRIIDYALLVSSLFGLIGFYIVFKCPGNAVRSAQFANTHNILYTLARPTGLFVEIFFRYLKPPFILALLVSTPEIIKLKNKMPNVTYGRIARWGTFVFFFSLVFLFLAPAHWAIGGAPPRRAMNILCFIHVLFIFFIYCQWVWASNAKPLKVYNVIVSKIGKVGVASLLIISFMVVSNIGVAWEDLLFRASDYARQQQKRIDLLEAANGNDVVFEPLRYRPETLFFTEIEKDPKDWVNAAVASYFGVKSVKVIEESQK